MKLKKNQTERLIDIPDADPLKNNRDNLIAYLENQSEEYRSKFVGDMTRAEFNYYFRDTHAWPMVLRPKQIMPTLVHNRFIVLCTGRGWGKSLSLNYWLANKIAGAKSPIEVGLVSQTALSAQTNLINNTDIGLFTAFRNILPEITYRDVRGGKYQFSNGAWLHILSAEEPDKQIRGKNLTYAAADELLFYNDPRYVFEDCLKNATRKPGAQILVATTPNRRTPFQKVLKNLDDCCFITGTSAENTTVELGRLQNKDTLSRSEREELLGEILEEGSNYFNIADIKRYTNKDLPEFARIVIGCDPCVSDSETAVTGIIVFGVRYEPENPEDPSSQKVLRGYVIDDCSTGGTPKHWAEAIVNAYKKYKADCVVCEINQGGLLIQSTIEQVDRTVPIRTVYASRGKAARCEPVSVCYQKGLIYHCGTFPTLEDQQECFDPLKTKYRSDSPDNLDALTWAVWESLLDGSALRSGVITEALPLGY